MRSKLVQIQALVTSRTKQEITERAKASRRSVSSFVAGIIYDWLKSTEDAKGEKSHGEEKQG